MSRPITKNRRNQIMDDLAANAVMVSDGFAFRTDDALESAYQVWSAAGRPKGATLRMDNEPSGQEKVVLTYREDGKPPRAPTTEAAPNPAAPPVLRW